MKNLISISLLMLLLITIGTAQEKEFDAANKQYNSKAYQEAISSYQHLINEGFVTEEVYYNLGNSYFKNAQIGYAVLYYEKTLKINPNNKRAKFNLSLTQSKLKDKTEKTPEIILIKIWNKFIWLFSPNQWTLILFISIWFSFLSCLMMLYAEPGKLKRLGLSLGVAFLFIAFFTGGISFSRYNALQDHSKAIITATTIDLKNSPDSNSNTVQVIYEGTKVNLEDNIGNWHKIKLSDGKTKGWVEKKFFEVI